MPRIIDSNRLILLGALVDWDVVGRKHGQKVAGRRGKGRVVQLRWLVSPGTGYPTEPFKVWRRPSMPMDLNKPIDAQFINTIFWWDIITWQEPAVSVTAQFQVSGSGQAVYAFSGAPWSSTIVDFKSLAAGLNEVTFTGPAVQSLAVTSGVSLVSLVGMTEGPADDKSWELVEIVGLPVHRPDWAGVFDLDQLQGFPSSLVEPQDAAIDRYKRGAPPFGWDPIITGSIPAPPWQLADPSSIIKSLEQDVHPPLRDMIVTLPPNHHNDYVVNHSLPLAGAGQAADAAFRPMSALAFAAATDPLTSLVAGFGTAFPDEDIPGVVLGKMTLFNNPNRSDWDYMVTATYSKGLDGESDVEEYAAIVWAPAIAIEPPKPNNLAAATDGLQSPIAIDQPWRGVVRVSWDKWLDNLPVRVGSYAFTRLEGPPLNVVPLMNKRPFDDALAPISATTSVEQGANTGRLQALDETYSLKPVPNPDMVGYALAHQDLFGLWSGWSGVTHSLGEPPVQTVSILSTRVDTTLPASGTVCPGTLVVELEWDWTSRSPKKLELVGRLYPASKVGEPPSNTAVAAGLQMSLAGGPGVPFGIVFNGTATGDPDGVNPIQYFSDNGQNLSNTPVVIDGPRRYRITISGLQLDFASTGHIGLALWARGQENRTPQRVGPWSPQPAVTSASDPRPPIVVIEHEDVLLASMADAKGDHHARLTWPSVPGSTGYFIYETTETKLRADNGHTDPLPGQTLSQRLVDLRDIFEANPSRRSFTRINSTPLAGTSTEVTIPRGSREIHCYVILGVSAGQVESPWPVLGSPNLRKRFIAYAAPQVAAPSRPVIEVRRVLDESVTPAAFRAAVHVETRPGATVSRLEIYRVRVTAASLNVDTMGPPLDTITGSTSQWTVTPRAGTLPGEAQAIGVIEGVDAPSGSWKRVYYRAVAWSVDVLSRGLYGGRSIPSAAQEVIVPPAGPPELSPLSGSWPGGPLADVLLTFTSPVPIETTPLGPHRLKIDVREVLPDGSLKPEAFIYPPAPASGLPDDSLQSVPTADPPAATGGLSRTTGSGATTTFRFLVKRSTFNNALKVRVMLTDPLGRSTERTLDVAAGSPLPPPSMDNVQVNKIFGKGFVLAFQTAAPVQATPAGPYVLKVSYAPGFAGVVGLGPRAIGPRPRGAGVQSALGDIPPLVTGQDPFAGSEPIPLRRSRRVAGKTPFLVYLRGIAGSVTVILQAPDGRSTSISRTLR